MDGNDEVQAGEDGREAGDEDTDRGGHHIGIRVTGAERSIEGPTGIDAAGKQHVEGEQSADDVDIPA